MSLTNTMKNAGYSLSGFPCNQGAGRDHLDSSLASVAAVTAASGPNHGVSYQVLVAAPAEVSAPGTGTSVVASLDQFWCRCGDLFLVVCLQGWFSGPLGDSGGYLPFLLQKM